jgi:hypothetical protein
MLYFHLLEEGDEKEKMEKENKKKTGERNCYG